MKKNIFDNSNIAESYAGVTTPLTFSFVRYVYQEVYQYFSRMMGVDDKLIEKNKHIFEHMVEFIGSRIYYNLNSWYKMLSFFPGYRFSAEFMEKMMGVEQSGFSGEKEKYSFLKKYFFYFPKTILQMIKISLTFLFLGWNMKRFNKYFEQTFSELNKIDLNELNLKELRNLYEKADHKLLAQWRVPIANDFAVMISAGLSDKLFKKWLVSDDAYSYIGMSVNKTLISLDPGNKVIQIAKHIEQDEEIRELFCDHYTEEEILKLLYEQFPSHRITSEIKSYFEYFGARMPNELKLESETLAENPTNFIIIIKKLVGEMGAQEEPFKKQFRDTALGNLGLVRRIFLRWLLRWAGNSIHRREEARFCRTLVFGFIRKIFLAMGNKMELNGVIEDRRDIFYLTVEEVFNIIPKLSRDFIPIIEERKLQLIKWENVEFPRRIETTQDISEIEHEILDQQFTNQEFSGELTGRVASHPNNIDTLSGVALTLKNFNPAADFVGKILVTCQTDPGWTIIFPLLKGVVVERGGMLSHAAIVARELNIPCVVGVEHATELISSGMNIKLDLQNGLIQKI